MSSRGIDRKTEIVAAAIDSIARLGFEGLRVRDVAQQVGINNATLHHHFPTKTALVAAVVEVFVARFSAAKGKTVGATSTERLEHYKANVRQAMQRAPETFIVMNELLVRANRDPEIAALLAPSQRAWRDHILQLLSGTELPDSEVQDSAQRCVRELLGTSLDMSSRGLLKSSG